MKMITNEIDVFRSHGDIRRFFRYRLRDAILLRFSTILPLAYPRIDTQEDIDLLLDVVRYALYSSQFIDRIDSDRLHSDFRGESDVLVRLIQIGIHHLP